MFFRKCQIKVEFGRFACLTSRLIALTQGQFAKVDAEDYGRLNNYKWSSFRRSYNFYAFRRKNGKAISINLFVLPILALIFFPLSANIVFLMYYGILYL